MAERQFSGQLPIDAETLRAEIRRTYTEVHVDIRQGDLVDTFARSPFEDTRRKAAKFGAMGSTIRATKPPREE